ncbi:hypothetical protein [Acetobacterium woodii]|nr:hypothetical protein [Acetobacterium woodii]
MKNSNESPNTSTSTASDDFLDLIAVIDDQNSKPLSSLIIDGLKKIKPTSELWILYLFIIIPSIVITCFLIISNSTSLIFTQFVDCSIGVNIAFFAAGLTGFALMQAIVTPKTIMKLSSIKNGPYNKFQNYLIHILGVLFYYIFTLVLSLFIKITVSIISANPDILNFISLNIKNISSFLIIFIYLLIIMHGIIEMFSLIFNLFSIYSLDSYYTCKEYSKTTSENQKKTIKTIEKDLSNS